MLADVGAETHDLDVGGVRTSVIEAGDGPPLVLLHGAIECGGIIWSPVVSDLAQRCRVIVPDVPGLGESDPLERLDLEAFSTWFEELLHAAHVQRPTLVAHSLLGTMAARYASREGSQLERVVISAAPGVGPYRMPWKLKYVAVRFAIRPTPRNAERFDRFALYDLDAIRARNRDWWDAFEMYNRIQARRHHVKKTMNRLIADQAKSIDRGDLARIDVPVTLLWGLHDRMVPLSVGQAAAVDHGWPLHVIDGAAHAPQIETPQEFVATLAALGGEHPARDTRRGSAPELERSSPTTPIRHPDDASSRDVHRPRGDPARD